MPLAISNNVLVSIVINCLNGQKTLERALNSIKNQTYKNFEVIFVDNGSSDTSILIAKSVFKDLILISLDETISLGAARSVALKKCSGELISFLDVDDEWTPRKLEVQVEFMKDANFGLCYAGINVVSETNSKIELPKYPSGNHIDFQLNNFEINMVTAMIRRSVLLDNNFSFSAEMQASEEYNLFMKIVMVSDVCTVPEILGVYHASEYSLTFQKLNRWWIERKITLIELRQMSPDKLMKHKRAYLKAHARGRYYCARALFAKGRNASARKMLWSIKSVQFFYVVLLILSYSKTLWNFVHKDALKRALTNILKFKIKKT
jgi:glycosyltransferase involved in cell wall biosynthesis